MRLGIVKKACETVALTHSAQGGERGGVAR